MEVVELAARWRKHRLLTTTRPWAATKHYLDLDCLHPRPNCPGPHRRGTGATLGVFWEALGIVATRWSRKAISQTPMPAITAFSPLKRETLCDLGITALSCIFRFLFLRDEVPSG